MSSFGRQFRGTPLPGKIGALRWPAARGMMGVETMRKQAEFYRLGRDGLYQPLPVDSDGIVRSAVLKGLWLKTDWLWRKPLPSAMSVLKEWKLM